MAGLEPLGQVLHLCRDGRPNNEGGNTADVQEMEHRQENSGGDRGGHKLCGVRIYQFSLLVDSTTVVTGCWTWWNKRRPLPVQTNLFVARIRCAGD